MIVVSPIICPFLSLHRCVHDLYPPLNLFTYLYASLLFEFLNCFSIKCTCSLTNIRFFFPHLFSFLSRFCKFFPFFSRPSLHIFYIVYFSNRLLFCILRRTISLSFVSVSLVWLFIVLFLFRSSVSPLLLLLSDYPLFPFFCLVTSEIFPSSLVFLASEGRASPLVPVFCYLSVDSKPKFDLQEKVS